jgi:hypothetical protein
MKANGFARVPLGLFTGLARGYTSGKVGDIDSESGRGPLEHYEISGHLCLLNAAALISAFLTILFNIPGDKSSPSFPGMVTSRA